MVPMRSGRALTEGDELYYEVRGQGQPLLMIAGGGGDAGYFSAVADLLADEYTVITYDRRSNSRSTGNQPQNFEVSQQGRDAVAVLRAAGYESALVVGNSGGAIIALEMARSHPHAVKAAILHEAPVLRVLPDRERWLRFFAGVYRLAYRYGTNIAAIRFSLAIRLPFSAMGKTSRELGERLVRNQDFLIRYEMLPFVNYQPDIATLKQSGVKLVMAVGQRTLAKGLFYGRPSAILAERLGCEHVTLPGHHNSYLDTPQEWAAALHALLHRA